MHASDSCSFVSFVAKSFDGRLSDHDNPAMARENAAGYLLAEEYLSAGDERFVATILSLHDPKRLAPLADKWKRDHRPAVRAWIPKYLDDGLKTYGHEPVVKRLFKQAEEKRDDE